MLVNLTLSARSILFLNFLFVFTSPLSATPCWEGLVSTSASHSDGRVYYNHRIRQQVREFLKRQIDYLETVDRRANQVRGTGSVLSDPNRFQRQRSVTDNLMAILESSEKMEFDQVTVNLGVLKEIRAYLEAHYPSALSRRPIRGTRRTRRRIQELYSFFESHHLLDQSRSRSTGRVDLKLLDIGAGSGQIAAGVAQELGIRLRNTYALELAQYPNSRRDINWITYRPDGTIPLSAESIDLAVTMMVFHHAPDPNVLIQEVARVLKPGGTWLVRETDAGDQKTLMLNSQEMIALNQILDNMLYVVFDPNSGVPMINNYRPKEWWKDLLESHGLKVEIYPTTEVGSPFNPIYMVVTKEP